MLPWLVWTFLIRGIIFGQTTLLNVKYLAYNMDSGYWFLFSIYVISIIFGASEFIANKLNKSSSAIKSTILTVIFYIIGAAVLAAVGLVMGLSFLCIKLTLYYMPFYLAGYLFGKFQDKLFSYKASHIIVDSVVALSCLIYLFIIAKVELFSLSDGVMGIAIRATASIFGCIAVCGLITKAVSDTSNNLTHAFTWVGVHSLEVYLVHYWGLNIIQIDPKPEFGNWLGVLLVIVNFALTMIIVAISTKLLNANYTLRKVLFGKK